MAENDNLIIHYSEGRGNLGKAKPKTAGWGAFCAAHSNPTRTKEKRKAFDKMSKEEQDELKSVDGWEIGAQLKDGVRRRQNIKPRDLLTLDYDYATPRLLRDIEAGLLFGLSDFEFFVHTTRRHTSKKPRIRLFMPMASMVPADQYPVVSRIAAMRAEGIEPMAQVDPVSFRPAQLMFKPTASVDGEFWCFRNEGRIFDPERDALDWFRAEGRDPDNYTDLPKCENEGDLRKTADKAEDPTTKKGPVGDWCRTYDVIEAISKFLPDCYAPADDGSTKPRYTYLKGTSTSGAVVEDEGLFLYSHHGSDPCADMLVNSFDLVRIHLFGELDDEKPLKDVPPNKWPSYKRMVEFANDDPGYQKTRRESRNPAIMAAFDDVEEAVDEGVDRHAEADEDESSPWQSWMDDILDEGAGSPGDAPQPKKPKPTAAKKKTKRERPAEDWFNQELEFDANAKPVSNAPNAAVIIHNDPRLWSKIAFNEFNRQIVCLKSIDPRLPICVPYVCKDTINGDRWQDFNDITLRLLLEAPATVGGYGMRMSDRDMNAAVNSAARRNSFHPVRDYLDGLTWDGEDRIERLFIDYLGCADNAYHRETAKWTLVASVARIYEPGHKFDYAPILQGHTGIRKSSLVKTLYSERWFGELHCRLDDMQAVAESIGNMWGGELPELTGFHKSDFNAAKAFMRRQHDDVRMVYDRRITEFPRQAVFWGTTNDSKYLKDPTGNRSYWPIIIALAEGDLIDTTRLARERDQIWAEAVAIYRAMRAAQPTGDLPLTLTSPEAQKIALELQDGARTEELHELWAREISDWLDTPIPQSQFMRELGFEQFGHQFDDSDNDPLVLRCAYTLKQAVEFVLKKDRGVADHQTSTNIQKAMDIIPGWHQPRNGSKGTALTKMYGKPFRAWHRDGITKNERNLGYRLVVEPEIDHDDLI